MAYNEKLANKVRVALSNLPKVKEMKMFRGITFMVNGKMCISISGNELMCRIDPDLYETVLQKNGCRPVLMRGREYKGFVYIGKEGIKTRNDFNYWIGISLDFNKRAKASNKRKINKVT